jgi:hypothetical protein
MHAEGDCLSGKPALIPSISWLSAGERELQTARLLPSWNKPECRFAAVGCRWPARRAAVDIVGAAGGRTTAPRSAAVRLYPMPTDEKTAVSAGNACTGGTKGSYLSYTCSG